jgi:hypothetical protein
MDAFPEVSGILSVSLHKKYEEAEQVGNLVKDIKRTNMDPHLLYSQVGKALGLIPEEIIKGGFLSVWCMKHSDTVESLLAPIINLLPKES